MQSVKSRNKREGWYWGKIGDLWLSPYGHWHTNVKHIRSPRKEGLRAHRL